MPATVTRARHAPHNPAEPVAKIPTICHQELYAQALYIHSAATRTIAKRRAVPRK